MELNSDFDVKCVQEHTIKRVETFLEYVYETRYYTSPSGLDYRDLAPEYSESVKVGTEEVEKIIEETIPASIEIISKDLAMQ